MAKRKNPLKDIDDFLKQESTSFVSPEKISTKKKSKTETAEPEGINTEDTTAVTAQVSTESILADLEKLASKEGANFRKTLYHIITQSVSSMEKPTAEDKMLINTLLFIEDKDNWKENIRNYWKQH